MSSSAIPRPPEEMPPVIRLDSPGAILQAVPYILRYHPDTCLVLIGTHGPELRMVRRLNLKALVDGQVWQTAGGDLKDLNIQKVSLIVYSSGPVADAELGQIHAHVQQAARTTPGQVRMSWVLTTDRHRWWRHDHLTATAPSGEGSPLHDQPNEISVLHTGYGRPASSRSELLAAVEPHERGLLTEVENTITRDLFTPKTDLTGTARTALQRRLNGPVDWTVAEAAAVLDALASVSVRNAMAAECLRAHDDWTWASLMWWAPQAWMAPVATLAAIAAHQQDDSLMARACIERALEADPNHVLAQLFDRVLILPIGPDDVREAILSPLSQQPSREGTPS